jgi:hypothetical protein
MWRKSLEHFLGNYSLCNHEISDKESLIAVSEKPLIQTGTDLLEEAEPDFDYAVQSATTQANEAFNSQKAQFASTNYAWRHSWTE